MNGISEIQFILLNFLSEKSGYSDRDTHNDQKVHRFNISFKVLPTFLVLEKCMSHGDLKIAQQGIEIQFSNEKYNGLPIFLFSSKETCIHLNDTLIFGYDEVYVMLESSNLSEEISLSLKCQSPQICISPAISDIFFSFSEFMKKLSTQAITHERKDVNDVDIWDILMSYPNISVSVIIDSTQVYSLDSQNKSIAYILVKKFFFENSLTQANDITLQRSLQISLLDVSAGICPRISLLSIPFFEFEAQYIKNLKLQEFSPSILLLLKSKLSTLMFNGDSSNLKRFSSSLLDCLQFRNDHKDSLDEETTFREEQSKSLIMFSKVDVNLRLDFEKILLNYVCEDRLLKLAVGMKNVAIDAFKYSHSTILSKIAIDSEILDFSMSRDSLDNIHSDWNMRVPDSKILYTRSKDLDKCSFKFGDVVADLGIAALVSLSYIEKDVKDTFKSILNKYKRNTSSDVIEIQDKDRALGDSKCEIFLQMSKFNCNFTFPSKGCLKLMFRELGVFPTYNDQRIHLSISIVDGSSSINDIKFIDFKSGRFSFSKEVEDNHACLNSPNREYEFIALNFKQIDLYNSSSVKWGYYIEWFQLFYQGFKTWRFNLMCSDTSPKIKKPDSFDFANISIFSNSFYLHFFDDAGYKTSFASIVMEHFNLKLKEIEHYKTFSEMISFVSEVDSCLSRPIETSEKIKDNLNEIGYSKLWLKHLQFFCERLKVTLKDYYHTFVDLKKLKVEGNICCAQLCCPDFFLCPFNLDFGYGDIQKIISENAIPAKFYQKLQISTKSSSFSYGLCYENVIDKLSDCLSNLSIEFPPGTEKFHPRFPLSWWDNLRHKVHGPVSFQMPNMSVKLLASKSPYEKSCLHVFSSEFNVSYSLGRFVMNISGLDFQIEEPKYLSPPNRSVFIVPAEFTFAVEVEFSWRSEASSRLDASFHHAHFDKYEIVRANIDRGDVFHSFRSSNVSFQVEFDIYCGNSMTFRQIDFMKRQNFLICLWEDDFNFLNGVLESYSSSNGSDKSYEVCVVEDRQNFMDLLDYVDIFFI
jgi:hypothetical protein